MTRHLALVIICFVFVTGVARAASPRFSILPDKSGGTLTWGSHTFIADGDRLVPKGDSIVDDAKAEGVSLSLEWETVPDKQTGDFQAASGDWSISMSNLKADAYIVSAERSSAGAVVFTLSLPDGSPVLKSPAFPIARGWSGH